MSNIFSQWQNKEISDIECIRGLNEQNKQMLEVLINMAIWYKEQGQPIPNKKLIESVTGKKIEEVVK